nr:G patch domain-containing protein TGH [Ipomoea batatas]
MDSDEEDFVFFGTPIEREEDVSSRKKKAVAEASGQLRSLPAWKQEVRDEEGRRRFHGAFTGGYSAGYYNTVGSKEGWTPQSFTSSRKSRAEVKQQSIYNFLDDDEKDEMEGHLGTSSQYDTFGFTAAELARKQAEKEQKQRPSVIPGPVPDELVVSAAESIGAKLLLKMGWRHGRSIKDSNADSLYEARREARKAFLALSSNDAKGQHVGSEQFEHDIHPIDLPADDDSQFFKSTPNFVLSPKQDLHGLGYDPFKHAPEFREKKRSRVSGKKDIGHQGPLSMKDSLFGFKSGRVAPGFGIGALEDLDVEDEDVYTSGFEIEGSYVEEVEEPPLPTKENVKMLDNKKHDVLPGFKAASNSEYQLERFDPPVVPKDFIPFHKFTAPLEVNSRVAESPPPEVPPPEDKNLRILIEGLASLVARAGKLFEDLSREKNQSNPLFGFLTGGSGHEYYSRRLWEERQKHNGQTAKHLEGKIQQNSQMTAESRGKILGEKPLERSSRETSSTVTPADAINFQSSLKETFTKSLPMTEMPEAGKPFRDDPAKQERFEQFLKEKYQGGLRPKDSGGSSTMSEAARARERLEFEAVAEAIEKGKWGIESKPPNELFSDTLAVAASRFTSSTVENTKVDRDEELAKKKLYPKREEFQWRPSPILCKRFDLIDPYMGKPPPAPRARSKMDSLIFMTDSVKSAKVEESVTDRLFSVSEASQEEIRTQKEIEAEIEVENVERPVDLYKAIFSDDSDDEEIMNRTQAKDPEEKVEAANTTLNRLIAGDFLESLGKELGLEVPPDVTFPETKASTADKEIFNAERPIGNKTSSADNARNVEAMPDKPHLQEILQGDRLKSGGSMDFISHRNDSRTVSSGGYGSDMNRNIPQKGQTDINTKSEASQRHDWSSNSSEENRSRKRKHNRHRTSDSSDSDLSDSSDDYRDRRHEKSKREKNRSSRDRSSSKRHSKHHKHRRRSRSSHHHSGKERGESRREKHKHKE